MSGRSAAILGRWPAHMFANAGGKQLGRVTAAISDELDALSVELANVRRAHRIGHADTARDLRLIAGLHGIDQSDLGLLLTRRSRLMAVAAQLEAAIGDDAAQRDALAEALIDLFAVSAPRPRLPLFAASDGDLDAAASALVARARAVFDTRATLDLLRERVSTICRVQSAGSGTVGAVLAAAANALDLDLDLDRNRAGLKDAAATTIDLGDALFHSRDLFFHGSYVLDRTPLVRRVQPAAPEKRIGIAGPVVVVDLARRMETPTAEVLAALRALGSEIERADATLSEADAERVVNALGFAFELENKGILRVTRSVQVANLAAQLRLPLPLMLQRLADIGLPGLDGRAALNADQAALAARKFGYVIDEVLTGTGGDEVIGIEENPLERVAHDEPNVHHTQRFVVLRRGFGRQLLQVQITARGPGCFVPELVNIDEGHGIGFSGHVPDQQCLVFHENGHAELGPKDGPSDDVTPLAYHWRGACFADADVPHEKDFVFTGAPLSASAQPAKFVVMQPAAALDREASFPSAGLPLEVPGIALGQTRFAFFVREAGYGARLADDSARPISPITRAGIFDQSVFAPLREPRGLDLRPWTLPRTAAADVSLSRLEHQAYRARVLVPARFFQSGAETEDDFRARMLAALERFRPLGVALSVEPIDDRWRLGKGLLPVGTNADPTLILRGGTALWPAQHP